MNISSSFALDTENEGDLLYANGRFVKVTLEGDHTLLFDGPGPPQREASNSNALDTDPSGVCSQQNLQILNVEGVQIIEEGNKLLNSFQQGDQSEDEDMMIDSRKINLCLEQLKFTRSKRMIRTMLEHRKMIVKSILF